MISPEEPFLLGICFICKRHPRAHKYYRDRIETLSDEDFDFVLGEITAGDATLDEKKVTQAPLSGRVEGNVRDGVKIGDFADLQGSTIEDIIERIPLKAVMRELYPVEGRVTIGFEFKWVQDGKTFRVRIHNMDPGAPKGSHAAQGWIVRIQRGKQYYDYTINDFQPAKYTNPKGEFFDEQIMNHTHIPIVNPTMK